jgi:hypothetical protein
MNSGISGTVSCLFGKLFHPFFFYPLIDDHPSLVKAGIKIGFVTGKLVTLVAEIYLFVLMADAHPAVFEQLTLFIPASFAVFHSKII